MTLIIINKRNVRNVKLNLQKQKELNVTRKPVEYNEQAFPKIKQGELQVMCLDVPSLSASQTRTTILSSDCDVDDAVSCCIQQNL